MTRAPTMRRARCPICGRFIALHPKGTFYRHGKPPVIECPGSGFTPDGLRSAVL